LGVEWRLDGEHDDCLSVPLFFDAKRKLHET
jgi:hypothetical protein